MGGVAISGLVLMQLDRILISKYVSLEEFGYYTLAKIAAGALYIFIVPVYSTVYPRMSGLIARNNHFAVEKIYLLGTRGLACILFPATMGLIMVPEELVFLWTRDAQVASNSIEIIRLLALACALHGIMHLPYALQQAYGRPKIPLAINLFLIMLMVPLIVALVRQYAALGGAIAWLVTMVIYFVVGAWITHANILAGIGWRWFSYGVGVPALFAASLGWLGYHCIQLHSGTPLEKVVLAAVFASVALVLSLVSSPHLWREITDPVKLKVLSSGDPP
jgi:O-antigen/teichoic acid export membrane protein